MVDPFADWSPVVPAEAFKDWSPPVWDTPEEKPLLALSGELAPASDELEQSARAVQKARKLLQRETEQPVTMERPSGAIGTTGIVIGDAPEEVAPLSRREQLKLQLGQVETLKDLEQIINSEGATMKSVFESQVLANRTKRPVDYEAIPPPLSEDPIKPGLLQTTVDYLSRPLSAIAGAEKAAAEGRDVPQAVRDALSGRTKTFSAEALEAAGVPPGPNMLDASATLGFGAGAPGPIEVMSAKENVRGVAGAALDVAQDPTTYLSLGTSRGLRLASGTILNRAGTKALGREIDANVARGLGRAEAREAAEATVNAAARGAGWIDKGGVKFFGRAIPGTGAAQEAAQDALKRAALAAQSTEAGARFVHGAKRVASIFDRDVMVRKYEPYVRDKQRYLNRVIGDREDIVDAASVLFHGITDAEDEAIRWATEHRTRNGGRYLYPPDYGKNTELNVLAGHELEPRLVKIASNANRAQLRLRQEEAALGLGDTTLEDYYAHMFRNYPVAENVTRGLGSVTPNLVHNLERTFETIEDAEAHKLIPVSKKASDLFILRQIASSRARRAKELIESTGSKFGREGMPLAARIGEEYVPAPNFRTKTGEPLYIPKMIEEDIRKIGPKRAGPALRAFDAVNNIWKGSVTALWAPFHVRNAFTNVANSFLDIGIQALNPVRHAEAIAVLKGMKGELVTELGERYGYDELKRFFRAEGLEGSFGGKIGMQVERGKVLGDLPPLSWGRRVGNEIEEEARMQHFLTGIRRGLTPEEAAKRTKWVLFDYEHVSPTERAWLTRILPFYKFTRFNIPYQIAQTLREPGRQSIIAKAFATPGDQAQIEKDTRMWPEYVSAGLAKKVGVDKHGEDVLLWSTGLPIEDLNRVIPQRRESGSILEELTKKTFVGLMHPLAKFIIEEVAHQDLQTGRPLDQVNKLYDAYGPVIEQLPESIQHYLKFKKDLTSRGDVRYKMDPRKLHFIRSFVLSRLYSTVGKQFDSTKDQTTKLLNNLTGLRLGSLVGETDVYPALKQRSFERQDAAGREFTQQKRALIYKPEESAATPAEIESLRALGITDAQLREDGLLK